MPKRSVEAGQTYGRLQVLALVAHSDRYRRRFFMCHCDCGNFIVVPAAYLTARDCPRRSCGCLWRESLRRSGYANRGKKYRTRRSQHVVPEATFSADGLAKAWGGAR